MNSIYDADEAIAVLQLSGVEVIKTCFTCRYRRVGGSGGPRCTAEEQCYNATSEDDVPYWEPAPNYLDNLLIDFDLNFIPEMP